MAKAINEPGNFSPAESIGLVFPVYMWGLPLIVVDFIKNMPFQKSQYIFAVTNCGGSPGSTLVRAGRFFKKRGLTLAAGFSVRMPNNYIPLSGAVSPKKQERMFRAAEEKVKSIAECIKAQQPRSLEQSFFLFNWFVRNILYRVSSPHIPKLDQAFKATEACTGCGICQKVCPVQNIALVEKKPVWQHHCQQCFACLQWCPEEAVEYGKITKGRKRYHHPQINVQDIIIK
jgi:Pyruvate/2-oxoacid:ferredoxin oxidoreductase delta subunit